MQIPLASYQALLVLPRHILIYLIFTILVNIRVQGFVLYYFLLLSVFTVYSLLIFRLYFVGSRRKLSIDENTQIFKVSTIHIHHSFELSSLQNDIAILRLSSPVQLSRTAWPICLSAGAQSITGSSNAIMIGEKTLAFHII